MNTRAITLVAGLAFLVAACGAEADLAPGSETDSTLPAPAIEGTSTTMQPESPSPTQPDDDYGVDPEAGVEQTTTTATPGAATPPEGPVDVRGGKVIEPVPVEDASPPITGEAPIALMDAIKTDLATHTGADPSSFAIIRSESVVWNDGSLGCPQPDVLYTQATVPGYRVVLERNGTTYDYRAKEAGYFVLCLAEFSSPPSTTPDS
jgi:hypothetical protein